MSKSIKKDQKPGSSAGAGGIMVTDEKGPSSQLLFSSHFSPRTDVEKGNKRAKSWKGGNQLNMWSHLFSDFQAPPWEVYHRHEGNWHRRPGWHCPCQMRNFGEKKTCQKTRGEDGRFQSVRREKDIFKTLSSNTHNHFGRLEKIGRVIRS